jgi:hypothetical protein
MSARAAPSISNSSSIVVQGGLLEKLYKRLHFAGSANSQIARRAILWIFICWIPPLLLASIGETFHSGAAHIDIFRDISFHVRCLLALPLLIAAETIVQREFRLVIPTFESRGMFGPDRIPLLRRLGAQSRSLRASPFADVLLVILSLAIVVGGFYIDLPNETTSWKSAHLPSYELARWWNNWISLPIYNFFLLRWIWKFTVWAIFLMRVAMLKPDLRSLHPDRVGGLGFLNRYHKMFGVVVFASSSVASSNIALQIIYGGETFDSFRDTLLLYLFVLVTSMALPLFVFTPALIRTRNQGLMRYGSFANQYARDFERKWFGRLPQTTKDVLGTPDLQSLNDMMGSFAGLARMRIGLLDFRTIAALMTCAAAPLLPLLLFKFPFMKLIEVVMRYFFKV